MDRRAFLGTLAGSLLAAPLAAEGQQAEKRYRVGFLSDESLSLPLASSTFAVFAKALRDLGWVEGQNLNVVRRYAEGKNEILPRLAAELIRGKVDIICAIGTPAAVAAKKATDITPIVFARVGDPVGVGLVESLARPSGNVTGVSIVNSDLAGKRLDLLKQAVPRLARLGVLWDPTFPPATPELREIERAAVPLHVMLHPVGVTRPEEFEGALSAMTRQRVDAVFVVSGPLFGERSKRLADLTIRAHLPMIGERREKVEAGGLMSYGPNYSDTYRRVATYVDRILKGARPSDLPVEQPTKYELVINLKTAKAFGLTIPPSLLLRADQVIE